MGGKSSSLKNWSEDSLKKLRGMEDLTKIDGGGDCEKGEDEKNARDSGSMSNLFEEPETEIRDTSPVDETEKTDRRDDNIPFIDENYETESRDNIPLIEEEKTESRDEENFYGDMRFVNGYDPNNNCLWYHNRNACGYCVGCRTYLA